MQIRNIPLADITPNELNPRKNFNQEELEELAQSIKENGLLQPITVRRIGSKKDGKYEIVCGERRYRACLLNGEDSIQAIVRELDDKQVYAAMIIENLQRKDIDPMEEAAALNRLYTDKIMTIAEIVKSIGKSRGYVVNRIQLHNTIPVFVDLMNSGGIALRHLLDICKLTPEQQQVLYDECFTDECRARWTTKFPNMAQLLDMIDKHVMNTLDGAKFSTHDDTFDFACACEDCPLNTKNNPDTFKEGEPARCMKRECFQRKALISVLRAARKSGLPMVYQGTPAENVDILKVAEALGMEIVGLGTRSYVLEPVAPDEASISDPEVYQRRRANYENIKAVFVDNIKDGTITAVFEVSYNGHLSGGTKYLYTIPTSAEDNVPAAIKSVENYHQSISNLKVQLHEAEDKRREELTERRRVFLEQSDYSTSNEALSDAEMQVFRALLAKRLSTQFKEGIGLTTEQMTDYRKSGATMADNFNAIMRQFIKETLSEPSVGFSRDLASMLDSVMDNSYAYQSKEMQSIVDIKFNETKAGIESKLASIREAQNKTDATEETPATTSEADPTPNEQPTDEPTPEAAVNDESPVEVDNVPESNEEAISPESQEESTTTESQEEQSKTENETSAE